MKYEFYYIGYLVAVVFYAAAIFAKQKSKFFRLLMLIIGNLGLIGSEGFYSQQAGEIHPTALFVFMLVNTLALRFIFAKKKSLERMVKNKMIYVMIIIMIITFLFMAFATESQNEVFRPFQFLLIILVLVYYLKQGHKANDLITEQKELLEVKNREILDGRRAS